LDAGFQSLTLRVTEVHCSLSAFSCWISVEWEGEELFGWGRVSFSIAEDSLTLLL